MDQSSQFGRERFLADALARVRFMVGDRLVDLFFVQVGEETETFSYAVIIEVDPVLVELVRASFFRVEPNCAGLGLAHFCTVAFGQKWKGGPEKLDRIQSATQVDPGGDVAPLVAAADLEFATFVLVQIGEVVCLQQHVTELGIA